MGLQRAAELSTLPEFDRLRRVARATGFLADLLRSAVRRSSGRALTGTKLKGGELRRFRDGRGGVTRNAAGASMQIASDSNTAVNELYRGQSVGVRSTFGTNATAAASHYSRLSRFVTRLCVGSPSAPPLRLLDVGCGVGWSTWTFAQCGFEAVGIDLNPDAFEPPRAERCTLREGDATAIPFDPESFDVVVAYQCLEHVPSPRRALDEMARVCRPGGLVVVVGPNLVSPVVGIAHICKPSSWRHLKIRRTTGMQRHPYGNTVPEVFATAAARTWALTNKLFRRNPQFLMREPDRIMPFHADNDACYLCNPMDLVAYFRNAGFEIVRRGQFGRPPLSYLIAGGTWVAARKPGARSAG
jgi:SAM-dependent methyltransferase